ncbi:MAG: hypothetical protein Q8O30_12640 [Candidatus Omnitrophota bacterium]|nr:hypothetical protein [Candidatus Omnitrophota bacterium]
MNKKLIISLVLIFLFSTPYIFAEIIILKSGKTVEGKIIEKTDKSIKIYIEGIPITYYFDEIDSIDGNKIKLLLPIETANNKNEISPVSQKKEMSLKETSSPGQIKDAISRENWINSKSIADYLQQLRQITLEVQQKGMPIMQKLEDKSKLNEVFSELQALSLETKKRMNELIPPIELSTFHQLQMESFDYGHLVCVAGLNKDLDKADSYYLKQSETVKKEQEEFKRVCIAHDCSPEVIQQIDQRIEEEEKEIRRIKGLHSKDPQWN